MAAWPTWLDPRRLRQGPARIIVPAIFSAGLVAFLLGVADLKTLRIAIVLPGLAIAEMVGLTAVFLVAKGMVWYWLVRKAGITASPMAIFFAYLGGETTKVLPGGIYFQNYLLGKFSGHRAEKGVATSLVMVGMEAAVCMGLVLGFGIAGWTWLRPALLGVSGAWVVILLVLWRSGLVGQLEAWSRGRHPLLCQVLRELELLYEGLRSVWHPVLWIELLGLTAVYLLAHCLELWVVSRGSPANFPLALVESIPIAAISILLPLMLPVPVQLGFAELSGAGALAATGMPYAKAISLMFALRLWGTGLIFVLALPAMAFMRGEWRLAMGPWPEQTGSGRADLPPCDGSSTAEAEPRLPR